MARWQFGRIVIISLFVITLLQIRCARPIMASALTMTPVDTSAELYYQPAHLPLLFDRTEFPTSADLFAINLTTGKSRLVIQNIAIGTAVFSPYRIQIAAARRLSNRDVQIVVFQMDGSSPQIIYTLSHTQLRSTDDYWTVQNIIWSSDSSRLAFSANTFAAYNGQDDSPAIFEVDVITLTGTLIQAIHEPDAYNIPHWFLLSQWLPDPNKFVYAHIDTSCTSYYIRNIIDQSNTLLAGCAYADPTQSSAFAIPTGSLECAYPFVETINDVEWSHNKLSTALILSSYDHCDQSLLIINLQWKTVRSYFPGPQLDINKNITWSPDNQSLAYVSSDTTQSFCILIINADGKNNRCSSTLAKANSSVEQIEWLPNNLIAVVISNNPKTGGDSQICVVDPDTFKQRCLTDILPGSATIVN